MSASKVFIVAIERAAMVLVPTRNITSLAEQEVQVQWDEIVQNLDNDTVRHIVFDFEKIDYFGSSMLEAMLFLWKKINGKGGRMAVCNTTKTASEVLRISKFDALWPICPSLPEALDYVEQSGS